METVPKTDDDILGPEKKEKTPSLKEQSGVNFINISWAASPPVDLHLFFPHIPLVLF